MVEGWTTRNRLVSPPQASYLEYLGKNPQDWCFPTPLSRRGPLVNTGSQQNVSAELSEQTRKKIDWHINRLFEEVARLSESDLAPTDFYGEFLQRVLTGIAGPAGAVWLVTPQGNLQLQFQINSAQIGLDKTDEVRQAHNELLRQAL